MWAATSGSRAVSTSTQPRKASRASSGSRGAAGRARVAEPMAAMGAGKVGAGVVDDDPVLAVLGGDPQVAVAQPLHEAGARQALARAGAHRRPGQLVGAATGPRDLRIDVDQDRQVGRHMTGRGPQHRHSALGGQATPGSRHHRRRLHEAVGDHHVRLGERREDALLQLLGLAGDVEEELDERRQRQVALVAGELPDVLGDRRGELAAGADVGDGEPAGAQRLGDPVRHRRLARSVDALEHDEEAGCRLHG
jgi:hypothetical protein